MAENNIEYLDYEGLATFWDRVKRRYDRKLERVVDGDGSIAITNDNEIAVRISDAEGNLLQLKTKSGEKGLYVPTAHRLTFGAEQEYVYDGTEDVTVPVYMGDYE